jgi:hypothetical protein
MPDNSLCEACGSYDVWRSKSSRLDKVVRFFTGRKRFKCNRCGWSALRDWDGGEPVKEKQKKGASRVAANL